MALPLARWGDLVFVLILSVAIYSCPQLSKGYDHTKLGINLRSTSEAERYSVAAAAAAASPTTSVWPMPVAMPLPMAPTLAAPATAARTSPSSSPSSACQGRVHPRQQLRGLLVERICSRLKGGFAKFLIFGTGWDSPFWLASNPNGTTFFMEHHARWVAKQPPSVRDRTFHVHYTTRFERSKQEVENQTLLGSFFKTQVPSQFKGVDWDVILVDSPEGLPRGPGRSQSVFAAALLAGPSTTIFLHDCNRPLEIRLAKRYLARPGEALTLVGSLCEFIPSARRDPPAAP